MTMMSGVGFGFGGVLMMAFWVLLCVFFVAAVAWLVLTLGRPQARTWDGAGGALRILEERLARGEIDPQEFRDRRAAIEGSSR